MPGVETASIESLVRMLLQQRPEDTHDELRQDSDAEEIILDIEVDGARYVLIRFPTSAQLRVQLSPRETEIVRLVAMGHSNKIIADVLSISSWTVCTHLRRIFAKLGVGSRAAMVAQMVETRRTCTPARTDLMSSPGPEGSGRTQSSMDQHPVTRGNR